MLLTNNKIKLYFSVYVLILFCVFLVYFNTLNNPFIWDDEALVLRNPLIRDWRLAGEAFTGDLFYGTASGSNFFRPVQTLSFMWDYHFWQLDPRGYHLTNIILQSLVSFLVFLFARALLKNTAVSLAAGLLFAICPLHTEAVTYISGRAEMLMGLFLIFSFLCFLRSENPVCKNRTIFFCLSLFSFILALLSKELAMVFPLCILSHVFYFQNEKMRYRDYLVKAVLPFFTIACSYALLRLFFLNFATLRPPALAKFPFLVRITVFPKVVFTYLKLLILPVNLHMSHEVVRPTSFSGYFIAWFALGLLAVAVFRFLRYKPERKVIAFLLSWSLIFILPQSGLFAINAFIAEHFIYLSSISLFIAVSWLMHKHLRKRLFIFCLSGILAYYGMLAVSRNSEWSDPVLFFERIIKFSPASFQAHNNLGLQYEYRHLYDKAIGEYQKALEIMPDLLEAHSNLANLYFKMGRLPDAKKEYAIVEKSAPGNKAGEIQNNIGAVFETEGLLDEALKKYRRALELDARLSFSHFNMARIYFSQGQMEEAAAEIFNSLSGTAVSPNQPEECKKSIGDFLKTAKDISYAAHFYNELGIHLAKADFLNSAIIAFQRVLELEPRYADAHFNLGLAYWKKGQRNNATLELKYALRINPDHLNAKGLLVEIKKSRFACRIFR